MDGLGHGLVMDLLVSGEVGIKTSMNFSSEATFCANSPQEMQELSRHLRFTGQQKVSVED